MDRGAVGAVENSPPACARQPTAPAQVPPAFSNLFKICFMTSPAIFLSKFFFGKFSKKSLSFWLNFGKHKKSYFVQKRLQTLAHNVLECRTKVNSCFCTVKWAKKQQFIICRGFCRDPLPCSGFILYLHFAGGKSSAGPLLYKP